MTNHFHLLLQLQRTAELLRWLVCRLCTYWTSITRRYGFVGHLWQGRFRSPAIPCEGYHLSCGRYIERSPLEAGVVLKPWQHARSSCRAYASGNADPLLAVAENSYYLESSADDSSRQQNWLGFLM
jgi:hypothetical protein